MLAGTPRIDRGQWQVLAGKSRSSPDRSSRPRLEIAVRQPETLARVASLYYEEKLTQTEIASRIHVSRSTVSRLLDEARQRGIVEVVIHYPWRRVFDLEEQLLERFALTRAIVLASHSLTYDQTLRGLGILAARHLEDSIGDGTLLGISWGTAVDSTVRALEPARGLSVTVVQMIGATDAEDSETDSPQVAQTLARKLGGQYRHLHAPLIVDDPDVRDSLLRQSSIRETLSLAAQADIALVGVGSPNPSVSSLLRARYLSEAYLAALRAEGAVGDICARHYDIQGEPLDTELDHRVVGVDLDTLGQVDQGIGVSGGIAKAESILGALRGEHVDVVVTDEVAARAVVRLDAAAYAQVAPEMRIERRWSARFGSSKELDAA